MKSTPRLGGEPRTRLFIKGNQDLLDSLLSRDHGGNVLVRGLHERLAEKFDGRFQLELTTEPHLRSDLALQQLAGLEVPQDLRGQGFPNDFVASHFHSRIFDAGADIIVLSLIPEMHNQPWKHNDAGYLLVPPQDWRSSWSPSQQDWLNHNFSPLGQQTAEDFKEHFTRLMHLLKGQTEAHVILFGCSNVDPQDHTYKYHGHSTDTPSQRADRFNLAMFELSHAEGLSVIDVDRLVAELGARRNVSALFHYSPEVHAAICAEFLAVIEDVGFFHPRPILAQVGAKGSRHAA